MFVSSERAVPPLSRENLHHARVILRQTRRIETVGTRPTRHDRVPRELMNVELVPERDPKRSPARCDIEAAARR
jgi:hypothetical protein